MRSYGEFFEAINRHFSITSMDSRGAWPDIGDPPPCWNWHDHTNDLITAIESQHNHPVIGMGHSLGGTITLMAANKRPDLFSRIVLIDAASLPSRTLSILFPFMPQWLIFRFAPFIKSTFFRQQIWDSRESFIKRHRQSKTYQHMTERSMQDYANHGLVKRDDNQYQLVYAPIWEAHNFKQAPYLWTHLPNVKVPTLLLRAQLTHLYSEVDFNQRNQQINNPNIVSKTIAGARHLAPLENPESTAKIVLKWL